MLLCRRDSQNSSQKMDKVGQRKAVAAVLTLTPSGQTNLWDGLVKGLEDLSKNRATGRSNHSATSHANTQPTKGHRYMQP